MQAADVDHDRVVPDGALLIGDRWATTTSAGTGVHINPAKGTALGPFALAGPDEVDEAVRAARAALPEWRRWTAQRRRGVLERIASLLEERVLEHSTVRSLEAGTPFKKPAPGGRWLAAEYFHYYAGWVDKLHGVTPPAYSAALARLLAPGALRSRRDHRPLECAGRVGGDEGRTGPGGRQLRRAQTVGISLPSRPRSSLVSALRPASRLGSSTWSPAARRPVRRWCRTWTWTRSASLAAGARLEG